MVIESLRQLGLRDLLPRTSKVCADLPLALVRAIKATFVEVVAVVPINSIDTEICLVYEDDIPLLVAISMCGCVRWWSLLGHDGFCGFSGLTGPFISNGSGAGRQCKAAGDKNCRFN